MIQGFYILAVEQMRRRKRIAAVMCALTLCFSLFAVRTYFVPKAPAEVAVAASAATSYFVYSDAAGNLVIAKGNELLQTGIQTKTLPETDQAALEQGITLPDAASLAKLLEDYSS